METQQQSDTTYRLYDYGRPRLLHLERGLASVKEQTIAGKVIRPAPVNIQGGKNRQSSMIAAPYFVVDLFELKEPQIFSPAGFEKNDSGKTSVQILVAVEGCGVVESEGRDPVTFAKGDAVVIPAAVQRFTVRPQWAIEFMRARVPSASLPEPATRL
jgi:mannose-6-phosphate isomerase